ncbi:hypothetical protein CASFOL_042805 [Castilleja foliolosa]
MMVTFFFFCFLLHGKSKQPSSSTSSSDESQVPDSQPIVCTEIVNCTQEGKMNIYEKTYQFRNFTQNEKDALEQVIKEFVIPLVKSHTKKYDYPPMWHRACKLYNQKAKHLGFENDHRAFVEVIAIAKEITWCTCPYDLKGSCTCVIPQIPEMWPTISTSGSSRKRSYESISADSPPLDVRVADALRNLEALQIITDKLNANASILFSNMIKNALTIPVISFLNEENGRKQVEKITKYLDLYPEMCQLKMI